MRTSTTGNGRLTRRHRLLRVGLFAVLLGTLTLPARVSAHSLAGTRQIDPAHGAVVALVGFVVILGGVYTKRSRRASASTALGVAFAGLVVAVTGIVLLDVLTPDLLYTSSTMPFPRWWYVLIRGVLGIGILVGSFVLGRLRWPSQPRYAFFGVLLGIWILYPQLFPGSDGTTHPIGYAIVLVTPLAVGYLLWADAGETLRATLRDPVARRFGFGVAALTLLFFLTLSGYLSVFPEEGIPHRNRVVVLSVIYQLVAWPTLEISLPHIPFFLALSPGQLLIAGLLSSLVGLNAALVAWNWRTEERAGVVGAAGSASIVGSCTCGCCGPLLAKVVVLVAGPAVAAPVYWLFVDSASPLSTLFIVGSIALFTWSIVRATGGPQSSTPPTRPESETPAESTA